MSSPTPPDDTTPLPLTPPELRLVLKLIEANDSGMIDRRGRLGGHKLRVGLAKKVYDAVDALNDGVADDETEGSE